MIHDMTNEHLIISLASKMFEKDEWFLHTGLIGESITAEMTYGLLEKEHAETSLQKPVGDLNKPWEHRCGNQPDTCIK